MLNSQYLWLKRFRRFKRSKRARGFSQKLKVIKSNLKFESDYIATIIENMRTFYGIVSFDTPNRFRVNPELRRIYVETYTRNEKLWNQKNPKRVF